MTELTTRAERYLRFSRRSMVVLLAFILVLGTLCLAMALQPETGAAWMTRAGWMLPIAITMSGLALRQSTLRGEGWNPDAPEARAIMQDEWRRANMNRATRIALAVVLVVQVPIGLAFAHLPTLRAVMAMAAATTTLGVVTLIACFLFFDRETRDDG